MHKSFFVDATRAAQRSASALSLGAVACTSVVLPPAHAQSGDTPPQVSDQVVVISSRARNRTLFDSMVPVDRFGGRELEQALGTGDVGQALQNVAPSVNLPKVSSSGTSDSVRVIQLRGLAPDQVLVLVNGKRRHINAVLDTEGLFPGTVPVDLNTIPASAIASIEILRDGAGAQYGSDAVAGVINIEMKRAPSGGSASVSYGANHTSFKPTGQKMTDGQTVFGSADMGLSLGNGGFVRFGVDAQRKNGTNRAGRTDASFASYNSTPRDLALDGQVLLKSGDSSQHGVSAFYNAGLPLTKDVSAYSFATASHRKTQGGAFYRYPGDPTNVPAIYPNGYRPRTAGDNNDASVVGGVRFSGDDWQLDGSLRIGQNRFGYGVENSLNASLGAASPTSFHLAGFRFRQTALNLDASRAFQIGLAEPLTVAFGADVTNERYTSRPGDAASYAAGRFNADGQPPGAQAGPGLRPDDAVDLQRTIGAVYADADAPITKAWVLGAAVRASHYSDSRSGTTGKLSTRYKVTETLLLRGSVSNSFRAPALAQTGFRFATLNFDATGTGLQNNALLPATNALAATFGAQPLRPETSRNLSLGMAWKPTAATTLTFDTYRIRVHDRITRSSDLQSDAVSAVLLAAGRSDLGSVAFLTNAIDISTSGVDLVANHELRGDFGRINLNAGLNVSRNRIDSARLTSPQLSAIDPTLALLSPESLLVIERGTPRSKLVLGADWSINQWNAVVRVTRFGAVYNRSFDANAPVVNGAAAQRFGASWSVDLEAQYNITSRWSVAVGGNNVFDRYPQRTYSGSDYGGSFPYDYINPIGINGAFYYARAKLNF